MAPSIAERKSLLLDELAGLVELLDAVGADHWVRQLVAAFARIEEGDPHAVRTVLDVFGGAGSLNDVLIHPVNGDEIDDDLIDEANENLNERRAAVWRQAQALARELGV